ncbi:sigma-54-dependent transcriptional regulator [Membranihabitans marinus]|uniref:sigma-54-dependent transcriptional regulator n=1 Tax=Membranihabitans marinus TaxID=1227546 RepID=UPI001F34C41F|nr:sigma-54 dependent transcriptional regulator [Membranihabitans marinus]
MPDKILIIDDDKTLFHSLKLLLSKQGYEVQGIFNPLNALEYIRSFEPNLILLDLNFTIATSGRQGLEILGQIKAQNITTPVVLITAWGSLEIAVEGMKLGAVDFITKPWDNATILAAVTTQLKLCSDINGSAQDVEALDAIIGNSEAIQQVKKTIQKIAPTDATVLITGESGTGKELVAEAIHDNSHRRDHPFVKVNLGSIPSDLFESEMFGHKKGAFTGAYTDRKGRFQLAQKGTIFLDEIGDLEKDAQVKLLRVLQEKTFEAIGSSSTTKSNVRVISATHRPLQQAVTQQKFREDLYYRLNLLQIQLPNLHQRRQDIPILVQSFVNGLERSYGKALEPVDEDTLIWLSKQQYPGNIRQLKNIVERTGLLANHGRLTIRDFQPHFESIKLQGSSPFHLTDMTLDEMEKTMIQQSLNFHNGNISRVARSLGITRSALYRRLQKHQLQYES